MCIRDRWRTTSTSRHSSQTTTTFCLINVSGRSTYSSVHCRWQSVSCCSRSSVEQLDSHPNTKLVVHGRKPNLQPFDHKFDTLTITLPFTKPSKNWQWCLALLLLCDFCSMCSVHKWQNNGLCDLYAEFQWSHLSLLLYWQLSCFYVCRCPVCMLLCLFLFGISITQKVVDLDFWWIFSM